MEADYLIVGGGPSGFSAVRELREVDPKGSVVLVTNEKYLPYDRPPLSKDYLRGETSREALFYEGEEFYRRNNVLVLLGRKVERLNLRDREAVLDDGEVRFGKALLATGGSPRRVRIEGDDRKGIYLYRTLDDVDAVRAEAAPGRRPLIIGGGFIGMEVAASLTLMGLRPTVVEVKPYIWNTFVDEKVASVLQEYFESRGVKFLVNESVRELRGGERVERAITSSGREVEADFVVMAVGISPNVELAQSSGLQVENGIVTDKFLRTSHHDVFASGDVANFLDAQGKRRRIEHWNNADYTGKLSARNMAGREEPYDYLSTVWSDIFDLHIEAAGETGDYDEYVVRGKLGGESFSVIYVKGGLVTGYLAVNRREEELEALNRLIKERVDVTGRTKLLGEEGTDLKSL
ncbi:pyridine nucleotide-disulfide oxidoreductase [Sulfodiicoccus acidiphilus]|uniref:Pyridine nucleotide-disulfide oxidoreductase n=2 Tax=Sulfodiicoccus acidiphilus TaxID=1670455 RepID=A0A348B5X9_9CREN|nr:FAD-dependent oxidoreductase [Sulfodiicoccus acidiphilus]BBD73581.1 pyridine nucleotide-disulfide oxidoreductase [Sulfodiicoccus acidiphilus]GGU01707.1 pyridine nucleotide-disulfide oxidoreductase [Sulfodiicoccus acidiphilus]